MNVLVLVVLCFFLAANFALVVQPSALGLEIMNFVKVETILYCVLLALCPFAALLDFVHGYLLDKSKKVLVATAVYSALVIAGGLIYSVGGTNGSIGTMIVGRIVYGVGLNPMILVNHFFIIHWFGKSNYLNLVYSVVESILWLGAFCIYICTKPFLEWLEMDYSELETFEKTNTSGTMTLAILCALSLTAMAFWYRQNLKKRAREEALAREEQLRSSKKRSRSRTRSRSRKGPPPQPEPEKTFKDYLSFPMTYWLFTFTMVFFNLSTLVFIFLSIMYFNDEFGWPEEYGGLLTSIITLIPAVGGPIIGMVGDKMGHNLTTLTIAVILNIIGQALMAWSDLSPWIGIMFMGVALMFSSGQWSQFQFLTKEFQYLSGMGFARTVINVCLGACLVAIGFTIDEHDYHGFKVFQMGLLGVSFVMVLLLWVVDSRKNFFLNLTTSEKKIALGRMAPDPSGVSLP